MKKFLALYRMDMEAMRKMMSESSPEDRQKGMEEWKIWMTAHSGDMADMGGPTGKNMSVTPSGVTPLSNDIGGYTIIQAESIKDAAKLLADNPHFQMPGSSIDLAEVVSM